MLEVIYKNFLILFITIFLIMLSYTGYLFLYGEIDNSTLVIHKVAGILLIILSLLHFYTKRKKVKKLLNEFIHIITNEKVTLDSDMDLLIDLVENKTLEEICIIFNISFEELNTVFEKNSIKRCSKEVTLKEVSDINSFKIFPLIVKILEQKIRK
ncbi:hypothetical protein CRV08_10665 [Halarcobacter ebronensis]|uniref:Uncharacterized protein n=1 Tax=Halarcobacter ebronensis TaxID=1462615 RepID=A0A4Q0YAT9_9BACT|nr:hypothetical protein [Halarcobacter ebronensis]RXJ67382.1 hypothetical protein CRV08_10665 [Halarcobacter ebronensis]